MSIYTYDQHYRICHSKLVKTPAYAYLPCAVPCFITDPSIHVSILRHMFATSPTNSTHACAYGPLPHDNKVDSKYRLRSKVCKINTRFREMTRCVHY